MNDESSKLDPEARKRVTNVLQSQSLTKSSPMRSAISSNFSYNYFTFWLKFGADEMLR